MKREFLYKRIQTGGRAKYEPVREIDVMEKSYPFGTHVIVVDGDHTIYKYDIDKDFASIFAAAASLEDDIAEILIAAATPKPNKSPINEEQRKAWDACLKAFGDEFCIYHSAKFEIAQKILDAITNRAKELMTNDAVKEAFEHYLTIALLSKESTTK